MPETTFLDLASQASRVTLDLTAQITSADLGLPTPCNSWNLEELLAHMTGQNRGFAAAAKGWGADPAAWAPVQVSPVRPAEDYAASVQVVVYSLSVAFELGQGLRVPDVDADRDVSARSAAGFYLVDTVAHGWDVARTLDLPFVIDDNVVGTATELAARIPDGVNRRTSDALFAPRIPGVDQAPLPTFLRLTGRSPDWLAPVAAAASTAGSAV